jgi:hypothetical protein
VFTLSKYEKWYWAFIEKYQTRGWTKKTATEYAEGHHPYPVGLFGKRDNPWRVWVTPREHYVLHLLLSKFTSLPMPMFWSKYTSREFSPARTLKSKSMQGEKHHLYGIGHTQDVKDRMKRDPRVRSVEGKIAITDGTRQVFIFPADPIPEGWWKGGVKESEETREKKRRVDPSKRGVNRGRQFDEEWLANMKRAQQDKPLLECPECGRQILGKGALGSHLRKHDPQKQLNMSLIAQAREARLREKRSE